MTRAAAFRLGLVLGLVIGDVLGLLVGLWLIARSIATPETASVPRDPYLDAVLAREA